jgi:hypothetical protein
MKRGTSAPLPRNTVEFTSILSIANLGIFVLLVVTYASAPVSEYLNAETVILAGCLALQTQVALVVERQRRDPFVVLLAFIMVGYYSLRFLTLLLLPFSFVLDRFPYTPSDSNRALLFILLANTCMYAGFLLVHGVADVRVAVGAWRARAPHRTFILVLLAVAFVYSRGTVWSSDGLPRGLQFVFVFLGQSFILLMALAYYIVFRNSLSRTFSLALLSALLAEMLLHTLSGSRSAIVVVLQNAIVVMLAFAGGLRFRRRTVIVGLAATPVFLLVLVASFTISTYVRAFGGNQAFSVTSALELSQSAGDRLTKEYALESGLPVIVSRAGFFDYSAEVIAHAAEYERIVNVPAYVRSIVDNLLTPGFDLFDQPKISNALRFAYADLGEPSKIVSSEEYQSDQLGLYGELYLLFGYASLPLFLLGAMVMKKAYCSIRCADPFQLTIRRVIVLTMFAVAINSFGLDWLVMDLVPLVASLFLYRYSFATRLPPRIVSA